MFALFVALFIGETELFANASNAYANKIDQTDVVFVCVPPDIRGGDKQTQTEVGGQTDKMRLK
jgi:hypothetical protein